MSQAAHEWGRRLSREPLPVLRHTLTGVRDQLKSSSVNHARLCEVISRDPAFSLYLFQRLKGVPNSPREPVGKISLAIPLLGMGLIEAACSTLPCLEERLTPPSHRGLLDCYSRSVHAAIYASEIGSIRRDQDSDTLYAAALLHDLGEMALWSQHPELMGEIHQRMSQGDGREDAALAVLGCTLEEINIDLGEQWQLPDLVRTAQGLANSYQARPLTVMLACAIARESSRGWTREETLDNCDLLADFLDLPLGRLLPRLHRLSAEAARKLSSLPYPLPAFHLISDVDLSRAQTSASAPSPEPAPTPPPAQAAIPPAAEQVSAMAPPEEPAAGPKTNPLQQRIARALDEMRQTHGLKRAMFAMLNSDKTVLRARLVAEEPSAHSLKRFSVDLDRPTLFSLLLKKPQSIALTPDNYEKYRGLIPARLSETINEKGFLVMSVFLHNKPVGLFYADNGPEAVATEQQYSNFKTTCQRTILSLG